MNEIVCSTGRVEELHSLAQRAGGTAVQYAIQCGQELLRAKAAVGHGNFAQWCSSLTFSSRTARAYMRAADSNWQHAANLENTSIRALLKAPSQPAKEPKSARKPAAAKRKITKKDKQRLQDMQDAKDRGISMLTTYANLTVQAIQLQNDEFTEQEREALAELHGAISSIMEFA